MNITLKSIILSVTTATFFFTSCADFNQGRTARKEAKINKYIEEVGVENLNLDTVFVVEEYVAPLKPVFVPEIMPYQATESKITDLIHTKLTVSFDWEKQHMYGKAELTLTPYFYKQGSVVLDAKGFDIHKVALINSNGTLKNLTYNYQDSIQVVINLDKVYLRGEKYKLFIDYTAKPNELDISGSSQAISDDKGLYFINPLGEDTTKPRQIWTQGETEASSCWFPTLDQPNEKTTQEVFITVDTNFVTISNGLLKSQMENDDGTRTDYWVQDKPHAPYLFMMAIGDFTVINDTWLAPQRNELIEVNYFVEKEFEPHAMKIFGNTPEMLGFFSKKLGYEYPWDKYSQVIVRDYVSGAMENTTASIFMEQVQVTDRELLDKNWDYIIAHELFHHWFGDLVTCESWGNLSLNESFANYSEYLWFEYKYGRDYADAHRQGELKGYLRQAGKVQYPIVRYNYNHRMDMFDSHSYNKGGLVLHLLRKHVGDEAFFESLKHYLHKNEYTDVEIHELRLSFEEVTGQDLNWFFDQWFLKPGHPALFIEKTYENDTLNVIIRQTQDSLYTPYYKIPTDLQIISDDGSIEIIPIYIQGKETIVSLQRDSKPSAVILDSEQAIPGTIEYKKDYRENVVTYSTSQRYQTRYDAIDELIVDFANTNFVLRSDTLATLETDSIQRNREKLNHINDEVLNVFIKALSDSSEHIRSQALLTLKGFDLKKEQELTAKYLELAKADHSSKVRSESISNLTSIFKEDNTNNIEIKKVFKEGLQDSSYAVVGESLLASIISNVEGADKFVKLYRNSSKVNILKSIGRYYFLTKDSTQFNWAINVFEKVSTGEKIDLIQTFVSIVKVSSINGKIKLINYFHNSGIEGEDIYTRYVSYRILHALDNQLGVRKLRQDLISKEESSFLLGVYKGWEKSLGL